MQDHREAPESSVPFFHDNSFTISLHGPDDFSGGIFLNGGGNREKIGFPPGFPKGGAGYEES
jgi:hypothetical protein